MDDALAADVELVLKPKSVERLGLGIRTSTSAEPAKRLLKTIRADGASVRLTTEGQPTCPDPPKNSEGIDGKGWGNIKLDASVDCDGENPAYDPAHRHSATRGVARTAADDFLPDHKRPLPITSLEDGEEMYLRCRAVDPGNIAVAAIFESLIKVRVANGELQGPPPSAYDLAGLLPHMSEQELAGALNEVAEHASHLPQSVTAQPTGHA